MTGRPWSRVIPEPEDVPVEAQYSARGLRKWLDKRRERLVPEQGYQNEQGRASCAKGCTMHDHKS